MTALTMSLYVAQQLAKLLKGFLTNDQCASETAEDVSPIEEKQCCKCNNVKHNGLRRVQRFQRLVTFLRRPCAAGESARREAGKVLHCRDDCRTRCLSEHASGTRLFR